MKTCSTLTRLPLALGLALVVGLAAPRAEAEVGVLKDEAPTLSAPMLYLMSVSDDPDLSGPGWSRLSPQTDTRRDVLNENGDANGDGPPTMLFNPVSNLPVVAWALQSGGGFDVVVSVYENGAWTPPQVVAGSAADELDPHLVMDPATGDVHLFYWVQSGSSQTVVHQQAPPDLTSWSSPEPVSAQGEAACRPAGAFHAGVLYVAYEVHDFGFGNTPRNVVLAKRTGQGFEPQVVAVTQFPKQVRPQVHSHGGRLWVDWVDSDNEIAWIRWDDALGSWEPTRYEPYQGAQERDFVARRAIQLKAIAP